MNMTKVLATESENLELLRIGDSSSPLVLSINSYQGVRYFDVRRHYFDKANKVTKPGIKGISLKEDEFGLVINFIESNLEKIKSCFTDNLKADEMSVRGSRREWLARNNLNEMAKEVEVSLGSWPGSSFFHYELNLNVINITFNKRHKFIEKILLENEDPKDILASVIKAYIQAKLDLDFSKKMNPEAVAEFIELHWGSKLG